jgi:hypothetical protein
MGTRRRFITAVGVSASVALRPLGASAEPVAVDFSPSGKDNLPTGFTLGRTGNGAPAAWAVQPDASAASKQALVQTSGDTTDYRFPRAIYDKINAANVEVTVRFKAVAGRVDRAAGLMVRLADPNNYYVVRANALEGNVNLYRVVKGSRREIQGASAPVPSNVWQTLGLQANGDKFTVSFNGKELFTATDRTFANAGKIGLWTKADSITHFDGLTVSVLP